MKNKILVLATVMALTLAMTLPTAVVADNTSGQEATTTASTSLLVVAKATDAAIITITFPAGAPGATVSAPYNNVDTSSDPQVLDVSASEPVVRIKNETGGALAVTLEITSWTNGIVSSENYELIAGGTTTVAAVEETLSTGSPVVTGLTIANGAYGDLYLQVVLGAVTSISGTSTLSVLGETP
ncbi:hypothetical protein DGWBC_0568 [Dehalogenimonas sp. WBC-2]|nr:hypothetical protein DGWBC_0568 [Dehalogenimonas sp. WBC-2]